jgi:hypothetical protein
MKPTPLGGLKLFEGQSVNLESVTFFKKSKKKLQWRKERNLVGHPGRHEIGGSGERKLEATTVQ